MDDDDHLSEVEHTISLIIRPHEEHHSSDEDRVAPSLDQILLSDEENQITSQEPLISSEDENEILYLDLRQ